MNLQQLLETARQAKDIMPRMVLRGWSCSERNIEKTVYHVRLGRYRNKSDRRGTVVNSDKVRLSCKV